HHRQHQRPIGAAASLGWARRSVGPRPGRLRRISRGVNRMNIVKRSFAALNTTLSFDSSSKVRSLDALLVVCAILATGLLAVLPAKQSLLNIEIDAGGAGTLQVFFDQGGGFSE